MDIGHDRLKELVFVFALFVLDRGGIESLDKVTDELGLGVL